MKLLKHVWLLLFCIGCVRGSTSPADRLPVTMPMPTNRSALPARYTIVPVAAHHQHLLGPAMMAAWRNAPMPSVQLPPALDSLLRAQRALIGVPLTSDSYKDVYASNAIVISPVRVVEGAEQVARMWAGWGGPAGTLRYVLPERYEMDEDHGYIAGTIVQHPRDSTTRYAQRLRRILMHVEKGQDEKWRIAAESHSSFAIPEPVDTLSADSLIADLNEAGIERAVIAALGYHFAKGPEKPGELALVQAENDWTVRQAARFPDRLVVFCGVHPLRTYAIAEMDRCAKMPPVRGMKLHFADRVDLANAEHVEKARQFFRAANDRRMPLLVHLPMDWSDGDRHARTFFEQVLPVAPDIPIQIAHVAGTNVFRLGAPDAALKIFADAAAAGNPLMKNLYFDVTGTVHDQSAATLDTLAQRLRTIGLERILFGSDLPFFPLVPVGPAWARFRRFMPLTDDELRVIAGNVAPYAR